MDIFPGGTPAPTKQVKPSQKSMVPGLKMKAPRPVLLTERALGKAPFLFHAASYWSSGRNQVGLAQTRKPQ